MHRTTLAVRLQWPLIRSRFSTSARRPLMELTGFTEEQLTVRDAISAITSKFPNTYWQECDQNERDPKEFHAALAKDGWLGIALPEHLGGAGLGQYIHVSTLSDTAILTLNRNLRSYNDDADHHSIWCRNGRCSGHPCQRVCHTTASQIRHQGAARGDDSQDHQWDMADLLRRHRA